MGSEHPPPPDWRIGAARIRHGPITAATLPGNEHLHRGDAAGGAHACVNLMAPRNRARFREGGQVGSCRTPTINGAILSRPGHGPIVRAHALARSRQVLPAGSRLRLRILYLDFSGHSQSAGRGPRAAARSDQDM